MRQTLKERTLRAGGWRIAGLGLGQVIRLASNLVMTRLLAPEMFGVMAIALMVALILNMLSDIGVRQNIVQSGRDDPAFLDTAWVIQIYRGVVLWMIALVLSLALYWAALGGMLPPDSTYAEPILPLVVAVSSLSAVIAGFQSTKIATAHRLFDQRRLIQIELIGQMTGTAVMIALGVATHSIWALVAGALVVSLTTMVLSHVLLSGHANRFRWEAGAARELVDFGRWIFISSAVSVFAFHGDRLVLAWLVDADVLGLYAIAFLIVGAFDVGMNRLFATISLPALSEIARTDPSKLRGVYYRMLTSADLVLLLTTGALLAAGQLVIDVLYDPRYSAAGGMLQILSLRLLVIRYGVATQLYVALGRTQYVMIISIVRCAALYALVPLAYYLGGLQGAIWAIALHALAIAPFVYRFNAKLGFNDFRKELIVLPALPAGFLLGAGLNLLR